MDGLHDLFHTLTPFIIFLCVGGLVFCGFYFSSDRAVSATNQHTGKLRERLDRANIHIRAEAIGIGIVASSAVTWTALILILQLTLVMAFLALPFVCLVIFQIFVKYVDFRINQRVAKFNNQLEMVLRMLSSSVRAGLGLRQAMIAVTEEMEDPVKYEFGLVVAHTNIGMSTNDALSRLTERMPSKDISIMVGAIQVQSQTGGNLGKTLDNLANTIKSRRKLMRKVKAITAEARASAFVIGALPLLVSMAVLAMNADLRDTIVRTDKGHMVIALAAGLELSGCYVLWRLLQFKF